MITKKELIEKLISFSKGESKLLLMDTNLTTGIVKLILKVLVNEIKTPQRIAFVSSHENFFSEVFAKTQSPIKKETPYLLSNHKISFFTLTSTMIKTPPSDIDIFIVYPIETLDEKGLIKFVDKSKSCKKIILINDNPENKLKGIKKLTPTFITLQDDVQTAYYNKMKSSITSSK